MLPLQMKRRQILRWGLYHIPGILAALETANPAITGYVIRDNVLVEEIALYMENLTAEGGKSSGGMPD